MDNELQHKPEIERSEEHLAERLYEWSGGIFWRGETAWQDIHREEARGWFAYADLLGRVAAVEALSDAIDDHPYTPECMDDRCRECLTAEAIRAALTGRVYRPVEGR